MPYIGKQAAAGQTETVKDSFNGDNSTTAFTMSQSVGLDTDIEVFVGNVQQEPGSGKAYVVSGTTLTFSEAPPTGTGNIYVDKHVDIRLYTIDKQEHAYDLMYVSRFDHFYVGVHARNTRMLPYDFELRVGREFKHMSLIDDKRYIMKAEGRFSYQIRK